jgi:hypothetical protein
MSGNKPVCRAAADTSKSMPAATRCLAASLLILCGCGVVLVFASAASAQSGHAPLANLGPVFFDFGTVNIGVRKTVPITVKNLTASPMTFSGGSVDADGYNAGFNSDPGTCSGSLAAGASCTKNFSFRPRDNLGTVHVATTNVGVIAGGRQQIFSLSFVGRGTGNLVIMRPRAIDFGSWLIGATATVPVQVTNTQDVAVSFAGGGFNTFNGFSASQGTCGIAVPAFTTCQFEYSFTPGQLGPLQNSTNITVTSPTAPEAVQHFPISVSGTGINSVGIVAIRPVGIGFGDVKLGSQVTVPIQFTNLTAVGIDYAGGEFDAPGAFVGGSAIGAGCTATTAIAGGTCKFFYTFQPASLGEHSASTEMSFSRPGASQSQTYQFNGTGVGELAQVSPVEFDFGEVALGTTMTMPVTILNDGGLALTGFIGGGVAAPFSQTNNCPNTLSPQGTCTFTYQFSANPNSIGSHEAVTLISFTNFLGVQPTKEIRMRATGVDRMFRSGFE